MNLIGKIKEKITEIIKKSFSVSDEDLKNLDIALNVDKEESFGDLSCNAAMILAKELKQKPREVAEKIKDVLVHDESLKEFVGDVEIAGPGFLNINLSRAAWQKVARELLEKKGECFKPGKITKQKFLVEFVSANPTGPLHLGHGRGGIIGDVLSNILLFLGHDVLKEFYINDAGSQIAKLGLSLKVRCQQQLGQDVVLPEDCYAGEYIIDLAKNCVQEIGKEVLEKPVPFFENHATRQMLNNIKKDLSDYGISFDEWFSEKSLHEEGLVKKAMNLLLEKDMAYEKDGAIWFRSTKFGDDKDRVIQKQDKTLTYIAADIAYHKNKLERGYDKLIDILGQDHHGYVRRLKATMEAIGFNKDNLDVILYQLVSIKKGSSVVKMSKRAGTFTTLREIIDTVGKDVARFFYLNRKAEAHLEFDLETALKKTEENPAFYIQYAYVRTGSLLGKAKDELPFAVFLDNLAKLDIDDEVYFTLDKAEFELLKKIISMESLLQTIGQTYQTHLLSYYVLELAKHFHNYYANHRIIDKSNEGLTQSRLLMVVLVRQTLELCLDLLGISKPAKM